ncbi:class I SAM-dependent methyltransferase [Paenibacillus sp. LHD-117]|uniref:class I SAM-dependent methyltransferase n=1 Tax=Paenibacillus sp. LHD-117 TaxID=3071412 RepID=UPI0027E0C768|nr:class I SAM-dependent methyltransferase [Paenibacillus sp. LHD-117]MDQ6418584.1 class I SAM-dependent methyltransferase [Paenibacillus sp. LHD-117]
MNNKERFTDRVDTYVKYRPSYPQKALDFLYGKVGFSDRSIIADIGAGTGIFSGLLLDRGSRVVALEPNEAMREAAIKQYASHPRYASCPGSAERTGLSEESVHHIVCAQSFHWFDRPAAREEFRRILKPDGRVALIWNSRRTAGTPFLEQFEQLLLRYGTDYEKVGHKNITRQTLSEFFSDDGPALEVFASEQRLDEEGLKGRLLSSSYCPLPGHPNYEPMMERLSVIFKQCAVDGLVTMTYDTELYWGTV